jgi:hypothetical protein
MMLNSELSRTDLGSVTPEATDPTREARGAIERAYFLVRLASHAGKSAPRLANRSVVVACAHQPERLLLAEYMVSRGVDVILWSCTTASLSRMPDSAAVLVVVQPHEPAPNLCKYLRGTGYRRDICYLPSGPEADEAAAAAAVGATILRTEPGDPSLIALIAPALERAFERHPPRLSFGRLAIDLDSRQVWMDGKLHRHPSAALLASLELLMRKGSAGADLVELCSASGTSTHDSAPRKLISRLQKEFGHALEKCGTRRYRLKGSG